MPFNPEGTPPAGGFKLFLKVFVPIASVRIGARLSATRSAFSRAASLTDRNYSTLMASMKPAETISRLAARPSDLFDALCRSCTILPSGSRRFGLSHYLV